MSDAKNDGIFQIHNQKATSELLEIWKTNNRLEWSDATFEVIPEILKSRGIEIPPQDGPVHSNLKPPPPDISSMGFAGFYFSTKGRVGLASYWLRAILPIFVISVVVPVPLIVILNDPVLNELNYFFIAQILIQLLLLLVPLFLFWCFLAMTIKRCHDRDKSGWFFLINFIPFIGGWWFFIETCCIPGTKGPNQFGTKSF